MKLLKSTQSGSGSGDCRTTQRVISKAQPITANQPTMGINIISPAINIF